MPGPAEVSPPASPSEVVPAAVPSDVVPLEHGGPLEFERVVPASGSLQFEDDD